MSHIEQSPAAGLGISPDIYNTPVETLDLSARTLNKGVNADLQYFGFKKSDIDTSEIFLKFNLFSKNLPNDIVVRKISLMPNGFNVRKNVSKRTYYRTNGYSRNLGDKSFKR